MILCLKCINWRDYTRGCTSHYIWQNYEMYILNVLKIPLFCLTSLLQVYMYKLIFVFKFLFDLCFQPLLKEHSNQRKKINDVNDVGNALDSLQTVENTSSPVRSKSSFIDRVGDEVLCFSVLVSLFHRFHLGS